MPLYEFECDIHVQVGGDTVLTGAQITSTQTAIDNNKNSFTTGGTLTTTDLHNTASFEAKSMSVGLGAGTPSPGAPLNAGLSGVGLGSDQGSASSTSTAGISGVAGHSTARTGDRETGLQEIFNKEKVRAEVSAQTAIAGEFGKQASKAVGDYAGSQLKELNKQANAEADPGKKAALLAEAAKWEEGGAKRVALHTLVGGLTAGAAGALGAGTASAAAPRIEELQSGLKTALKDAGVGDSAANLIASLAGGATAAGIGGAASGGSAVGAATAFNADMNNRQLHPSEAKLIKDNAKRYADKHDISVAQAEAELTQQSLRNVDSAHDKRLGEDNPQAQAFLKELGQGQAALDPLTGQRFELFTANEATRNNQAMFGQYAKLSPETKSALDRAYEQAFKPAGARTIAGLNGTNAGALTGSDLALNDAARDYKNMRQEPQVVQWAVLGQLRQERAQNLQTQQRLLTELQGMNQRGETGAQAAQRRGEIVNRLNLLDHENQVMRQASVEQLKAMGSAGTTNPARHREWAEGAGEAIAASRLTLQGLSAASINSRLNALKGAVEEVQAASAVAKAEAQAVARARVENNVRRDDAQQYVNTNAPVQVPNTVTRNDNDFSSTVNHRGNPKAHIDESGSLVSANPKGTGSPTAHVSGSNPGNTPYISTTDAASVDPTLGGPKTYGSQQTTINARDLQRDINSGAASQDIKIINNQQLVQQLEAKVDAAQRRFDANPSNNSKDALDRARESLHNAKRDGEVLITPHVPPAYYTKPIGPVTSIGPVPKAPSTPTTRAKPIK